jgi:DNA-binding CsgD family transcriptional regulator
VAAALEQAAAGRGSFVLVEGEAGIGKSSLIESAVRLAEAAGLGVLTARASELERHYPFGIVVDLFRPLRRDPAQRADLFGGAAALAEQVFAVDVGAQGGTAAPPDPFAALHGLFWLTINAVERRPTLIVVDDAHWADDSSLRFLHYLVQRVQDLAAVVLVAQRPGEGAAASGPGAQLTTHADATVIRLSPLSSDGVAHLVATLGVADPTGDVARACWLATQGNPYYATELLRSGATAADARNWETAATMRRVPERVTRSIRARLDRIGESARAIAEAVAVLGDGTTIALAASLADIDPSEATDAVRHLVDAAILRPAEGLAFIHPIARDAVYLAVPESVRATSHRRAAALLHASGAPVDHVAVHLLEAEPASDPQTVDTLCRAAAAAVDRCAHDVAQAYLRRALDEPPEPSRRAGVLVDLARANAAIGTELAVARYREALEAVAEPVERAAIMLELGHALINAVQWEAATDVFESGLREAEGADPALVSRLEAGFVSAAFVSLTRRGQAGALLERILAAPTIDPGHRELAVWTAFQRTATVTSTAAEMLDLVHRSLGDAPMEDLVRAGQLIEVTAGVLVSTDELELELDLLTRALDGVQRMGWQAKFGVYSYCRAWPQYYTGRLAEAITDGLAAISAAELGWETFYPGTCAVLGWAHLERGEIGEAERVIALDDERWSQRLDYQLLVPITRGRIALERGQLDEAVRQFELARRGGEVTGLLTPIPPDWRSWMTITLARMGHHADARTLAAEGLELAERWGARWPIGMALRAVGIAEGGTDGIALLERAAAIHENSPAVLERARTVLELGAAERRAGRTVDAREHLRVAADLAHRIGATGLRQRALDELVASGVRPRRFAVTGIDALTPSELRVARLAAEGRTNREVAQSLFVTPKAVEYHLANAYRKLQVAGRGELAGALRDAASSEVVSV